MGRAPAFTHTHTDAAQQPPQQQPQSRPVGFSCLYLGRVWHARFLPTLHKFGCVGCVRGWVGRFGARSLARFRPYPARRPPV